MVQDAEFALGPWVALLRGLGPPFGRLGVALVHPETFMVQAAEAELGLWVLPRWSLSLCLAVDRTDYLDVERARKGALMSRGKPSARIRTKCI